MDSDDNEEIANESSTLNIQKRKQKRRNKKQKNLVNIMIPIITLLILLFMIIYSINSVFFNQDKKIEEIKSNIKNENYIVIKKTNDLNIENKENNTKNIGQNNTEKIGQNNTENIGQNNTENIGQNNILQTKNRNITEEIEQFVRSLKKVDENEILEFRKINSDNILYDKTKYKRSENPDISVI